MSTLEIQNKGFSLRNPSKSQISFVFSTKQESIIKKEYKLEFKIFKDLIIIFFI